VQAQRDEYGVAIAALAPDKRPKRRVFGHGRQSVHFQNSLHCSQLLGSVFTNLEHHLFSESQWRQRAAQSFQTGRSGFAAAAGATRSRLAQVAIRFGNSKNFSDSKRQWPRAFLSVQ
jgi:hypothetical protein